MAQNAGRVAEAETRYRALLADGISTDVRRHGREQQPRARRWPSAGRTTRRSSRPTSPSPWRRRGARVPRSRSCRRGRGSRCGRDACSEGLRDFDRSAQAYVDGGHAAGRVLHGVRRRHGRPAAAAGGRRPRRSGRSRSSSSAGVPLMATEAQLRLARISLLTGRPRSCTRPRRRGRRRGRPGSAARAGGTRQCSSASRHVCGRARRGSTSSRSRVAPPGGSSEPGTCTARSRRTSSPGRVALDVDRPRDAVPPLARARALAGRGRCSSGCAAGSQPRSVPGRRAFGRAPGAVPRRSAGPRRPPVEPAHHRAARPGVRPRRRARRDRARHRARRVVSRHDAGVDGAHPGGGAQHAPGVVGDSRRRTRTADVPDRATASDAAPARARRSGRGQGTGCGPRSRARPVEGRGAAAGDLGLAATRAALDGRTLVEFGTLEGRLVAVVVEPRRTRLVELGCRAGRRRTSSGRCCSRCAGWPTPAVRSRGRRRSRERRPADRPAAGPAHRTPRRRSRTTSSSSCPVGRAARRAVVLPARRAARAGAVGDVLGPTAAPRWHGTEPAGRSWWPVRT